VLSLARPPRWGIVVLVALVLTNAALFGYLLTRPAPTDALTGGAAPAAQGLRPAPSAAPITTTPPEADDATRDPSATPILAVYGDGYSAGSQQGGQGAFGWPALAAQQVGADLRLHAVSRAGYASVSTSGLDFSALVTANPVPDAAVTVVFGSRNDIGNASIAISQRAAETFQLVRAAAPSTHLVVVGPAWSDADVPADLLALRDAIRAAAEAADATFVDPLGQGWFSSPGDLVAADGISPTDAGHAFMASEIAPVLRGVLASAIGSSGSN
jgi:hypothetical protein